MRDELVQDVTELYEDLRQEHYASLKEHKFATLTVARQKKPVIDWKTHPKPVAPSFLGTKVLNEYPLSDLLPYIDWNPFFAVWQIRGSYPTRNYPRVFQDSKVGVCNLLRFLALNTRTGEQAKKLFDEAQEMLKEIVEKKLLTANGVIGFYPANSVDEDIEVSP
jgi:5-methyltetrahydrofolate--homocysteine methyltransferase